LPAFLAFAVAVSRRKRRATILENTPRAERRARFHASNVPWKTRSPPLSARGRIDASLACAFTRMGLQSQKGLIPINITGAEIRLRRSAWKPRNPRYRDGILAEYAAHVSSASEGAVPM
jgi:hypothetical protein